jgi:hypothetical protein
MAVTMAAFSNMKNESESENGEENIAKSAMKENGNES